MSTNMIISFSAGENFDDFNTFEKSDLPRNQCGSINVTPNSIPNLAREIIFNKNKSDSQTDSQTEEIIFNKLDSQAKKINFKGEASEQNMFLVIVDKEGHQREISVTPAQYKIIEKRRKKFEALLEKQTGSPIQIVIDENLFSSRPRTNSTKMITIPIAMLLKKKDLNNQESELFQLYFNNFQDSSENLSDKEKTEIELLKQFLQENDKETVTLVHKFILFHELGHIERNDICSTEFDQKYSDSAESVEANHNKELDCDRRAVEMMKTSKGATTLFEIHAKFYPNSVSPTHPSFEQRRDHAASLLV